MLAIHPQAEWGPRADYSQLRPVQQARWLFLHISVTMPSGDHARDMRTIESIGMSRFGRTIGFPYNAAVFQDGSLWEGQPLDRRGAHTVNDLPNGDFPTGSLNHLVRALVLPQMTTDRVTDDQIDAAARWGAWLIRTGAAHPSATWHGHREVTRKSCPGDFAWALLGRLRMLTAHYAADPPEDDMPLSDADLDAIGARVQAELKKGTGTGQPDWPSTSKAVLATVQSIKNDTAKIADPAKFAAVLAPILAEHLPDDLGGADLEEVLRRVLPEIRIELGER